MRQDDKAFDWSNAAMSMGRLVQRCHGRQRAAGAMDSKERRFLCF
ncbi:hypothetical protein [Dehalobacter sp. TBBPA1]